MREGGDLGLGKGKIDEMGENGKADGGGQEQEVPGTKQGCHQSPWGSMMKTVKVEKVIAISDNFRLSSGFEEG